MTVSRVQAIPNQKNAARSRLGKSPGVEVPSFACGARLRNPRDRRAPHRRVRKTDGRIARPTAGSVCSAGALFTARPARWGQHERQQDQSAENAVKHAEDPLRQVVEEHAIDQPPDERAGLALLTA